MSYLFFRSSFKDKVLTFMNTTIIRSYYLLGNRALKLNNYSNELIVLLMEFYNKEKYDVTFDYTSVVDLPF